MSKIENIVLFSFLVTVFTPQSGHTSASESPDMQRVKNLRVLQKDFQEWQVDVLGVHGHLVKVDNFDVTLGSPLALPINMTVIEGLYNITTPPAYILDYGHLEKPETHIKNWIETADASIHKLRFLGVSFSTSGLSKKYEALKDKMLKALEIE